MLKSVTPMRWPGLPHLSLKHEYVHFILWLLLFLSAPQLLRFIDITAAPLDPGVLSLPIVAVLAVLLFQSVTWWSMKIIWPVFANYSTHQFETQFKSLNSWQKILIYLGFYLSLLFSFVISFLALA